MNRPSPRVALAISLAVVALTSLWQLATLSTSQVVPEHFSEIVTRIAIDKVLVFSVLALLLWLEREGFAALGVRREGWPKQVGIGIAIGLLMFAVLNVALTAVLESIFPPPGATGRSVMVFFQDPKHLFAWLPIGIFGGGVVEELERIFILTRFEKWLGRKGLVLGVALSSLTFGAGHLYQGLGAALSTFVSGVVFSLVYLRRRSALEPMTAHAASDVIAILGATFMHQ